MALGYQLMVGKYRMGIVRLRAHLSVPPMPTSVETHDSWRRMPLRTISRRSAWETSRCRMGWLYVENEGGSLAVSVCVKTSAGGAYTKSITMDFTGRPCVSKIRPSSGTANVLNHNTQSGGVNLATKRCQKRGSQIISRRTSQVLDAFSEET
jgi:hypothetical protein